ncbi:MAG: YceI family protein [Saprospiraceae bacterium]
MKYFSFSLVVTVLFLLSSFTIPKPTSKTINIKQSVINWKGYKVLGEHAGTVKFMTGNLEFDVNNNLTGGTLVVDMNSIVCTDLNPGQGKEKLEGHLKSDDFFGTSIHPKATLKIKKVVSKGKSGEYKVVADLTIKNIVKEIKFDTNISETKAMAIIKIDRSDYDVKFGSGSFFDNLGDSTIYDEFDLNVNITF